MPMSNAAGRSAASAGPAGRAGASRRDVVGRRVLRPARGLVLGVVLAVVALMDLIYTPWVRDWMEEDPDTVAGWKVGVLMALMFGAMLHGLVLRARARRPTATLVVVTAIALVLPFSPLAALVVLSSHLSHRRLDRPVLACSVVALATVVCTWRDLLGQTTWTSWVRVMLASSPSDHAPAPAPWPGVALFVALAVGSAIGIGLLRRSRADARRARAAAEAARSAAQQARTAETDARRERDDAVTTASRTAEREQVAREIHDGIGHRLSLLSLEAGALQLEVQDDPRLAESAARVRSQAAAATEDLRSLVGMLREPTPEPVVTLDHLQTVLDESADAGQLLSATVRIDDGASAPATLARAVHRITTEIMTNARKHAPGEILRLRVTGGPGHGVEIEGANRVPAPAASPGEWHADGSSSGLVGIVERAELLGGSVRYGVDGDRFRVTVHLPWPVNDVGGRS
ncbi:sensor histidine kinase [Georgenia sp. Z1344]|uniref:sensor histidine kinase n=1 Tax=Georgenia sp. Z1344 TaxID=3416706 RepID=UPI003CEB1493